MSLERFEVEPDVTIAHRLDFYQKLLRRFYEPLVLLRLLGRSHGNHKTYPHHPNNFQSTRRQFLQNLAYICDYEKGGNTCTAIGLEELDVCYRFWVASNEKTPIVPEFLTIALQRLSEISNSPESEFQQRETDFSKLCVDFARPRIFKERKLLSAAIRDCQRVLSSQDTKKGMS